MVSRELLAKSDNDSSLGMRCLCHSVILPLPVAAVIFKTVHFQGYEEAENREKRGIQLGVAQIPLFPPGSRGLLEQRKLKTAVKTSRDVCFLLPLYHLNKPKSCISETSIHYAIAILTL